MAEKRTLRLLVAEDNKINRMVVKKMIEKMGHQVETVQNGEEALAKMEEDAFDIVLMDVSMPVLDGIEATRKIRQKEKQEGRHTPIIALTAHAMDDDRERFLSAGMDDYLTKPIDKDILTHTIQQFET
jgi:CheY-like chemotaxis protein